MKYFLITGLLIISLQIAQAQYVTTEFPRVAFTYDFNVSSDIDAYGPRAQLYSKNKLLGNVFSYAYGVGLGNYRIRQFEGNNRDTYHIYAILMMSYETPSRFSPFIGLYPGGGWGMEKGWFLNPTTGVNIKAFHFNRNWNTQLLQAYIQVRVEYNTLLSAFFLGGGLAVQFL